MNYLVFPLFLKLNNRKHFAAFTLAEVLITLAIIGIVAAMTIPGIVLSVQKDQYASKLKKEYSVLSQAYNSLAQDAGGSITDVPGFSSTTGDVSDAVLAMNALATKLNVAKNCGSSLGCWYDSSLRNLGGNKANTNLDSEMIICGKALLADGTMMRTLLRNTSCTTTPNSTGTGPLSGSVCGSILIDVNGASGPNQSGRDVFIFWIAKTGLYPLGTYNDGYSCDVNSLTDKTSYGCTAKVLQEGAMNY